MLPVSVNLSNPSTPFTNSGPLSQEKVQEKAQEKGAFGEQLECLKNELLSSFSSDPEHHAENSALCSQLLKIFDIPGQRIDFSHISPTDLSRLDEETWQTLGEFTQRQGLTISQICLPEKMTKLPKYLCHLLNEGNVDSLIIPKFEGKSMNLARFGIRNCKNVHIDSVTQIDFVSVPKGCEVFARHAEHKRKIRVQEYIVDEDGCFNCGEPRTAYGNAYIKGTGTRPADLQSLNCMAQYKSSKDGSLNRVTCIHLSDMWIEARKAEHRRLREAIAANPGVKPQKQDIYRDKFGSLEKIQQSTPGTIEEDYCDKAFRDPVKHTMYPLAQLGKFLDDEFQKMHPGDVCHFLIENDIHTMAVELVLTEDGRKVVRFFDPNSTLVHTRIIESTDRSLAGLSFIEILPNEELAGLYHGNRRENAWFCTVPDLDNPTIRRQGPSVRSLDMGPFSAQNISPSIIYSMQRSGFNEELEAILRDPLVRDNPVLLVGKDQNGQSALEYILSRGNAATAKVIVDAILASKLSLEQKMDLLTGKGGKQSHGVWYAANNGYAATVKIWIDAILALNIKPEELETLLEGKGPNGQSMLSIAAARANTDTVKVIVDAILASKLSPEKKVKLLAEENNNPMPVLCAAFHYGQPDIVKVIVNAVLQSADFSDPQKMALLNMRVRNGTQILYYALEQGQTAALQAMVDVILKSNLSEDQKRELLTGMGGDGTLGVWYAANNGYAATVKIWMDAMLALNIKPEVLEILLEGKGPNGQSMLNTAAARGDATTVKVIVDAILASKLSPEKKIRLLAMGNNGMPVLCGAFQYGQPDIVKAMVAAILKSADLSDPQKMALLNMRVGNGTQILYYALQYGHTSSLQAMVDLVLGSQLSEDQKRELLTGMGGDGTPGIWVAVRNGHAATVKAYVDGILALNLENDRKIALLEGRHQGRPVLYLALQNNDTATVVAIVTAILTSQTFSDAEKTRLLEARNDAGEPGLYGPARPAADAFISLVKQYGMQLSILRGLM